MFTVFHSILIYCIFIRILFTK